MLQITVPRTNSNDDTCILVQWLYADGQEVQEGDVLAYLETSKATEDLLSPGTGKLSGLAQAGEEYEPGSCIGYLLTTEETSQATSATPVVPQSTAFVLTRSAQEVVQQHGITDEQLASLGKKLLKQADVLALVSPAAVPVSKPDMAGPSSRNQASVAWQVTRAHQSIPAAFSMIKIYCDAARQAIAAYIESAGVVIGWTEVLIHELGAMRQEYPAFYPEQEQREAGSARNPGIGVTIDVGTGLYIPVIKAAATRSLDEIAAELMEFRLKALQKTLKEEELRGGHLTVSLHTDRDILVAIPIIFPTQTCMLSLCSEQEELYLREDGSVGMRHYLTLGAAYDHRVINGAEAAQFLQEIKRRFEDLEEGAL